MSRDRTSAKIKAAAQPPAARHESGIVKKVTPEEVAAAVSKFRLSPYVEARLRAISGKHDDPEGAIAALTAVESAARKEQTIVPGLPDDFVTDVLVKVLHKPTN